MGADLELRSGDVAGAGGVDAVEPLPEHHRALHLRPRTWMAAASRRGRRASSCVCSSGSFPRLEAFFNWGPAQLRQCGGLFRFRVSETNRHAACVIRLQYDGDAFCSAFVGLRSCACDYVNVWFGKQIFLRYTTKMKSIDTFCSGKFSYIYLFEQWKQFPSALTAGSIRIAEHRQLIHTTTYPS